MKNKICRPLKIDKTKFKFSLDLGLLSFDEYIKVSELCKKNLEGKWRFKSYADEIRTIGKYPYYERVKKTILYTTNLSNIIFFKLLWK